MWFLLSCAAAFSNASYSVGIKFLPRYSGLEIAAISHIICGFIALLTFLYLGLEIPETSNFLIPAFITVMLNIIAVILLFRAISESEISISLPFLSLTPILTAVLAFAMRGETLSVIALIGLIMIVAGTFTIEAKTLKDFMSFGGVRVFQNKGVILVSIVAVLFGISSVFDKDATLASDPLTFSTASLMARGIFFFVAGTILITRAHDKAQIPIWHFMLFTVMGVLLFTELLSQMWALTDTMVANVIAVKRLSMLITSVAGFMIFKEAFTYARASGIALMVCGSVIIYYG